MVVYLRGRDGSKLGGRTGAEIFCMELGLQLHFGLKDDCSKFLTEIFAILKTIDSVAGPFRIRHLI